MDPYRPYGACRDVIHDRRPEVVISGPAGTGKSLACLWKLAIIADDRRLPPKRLMILRKTRTSCTQSVLVTFETHVLGPENPICMGTDRRFRESYKWPNGSEIVVGGLDNIAKIMSTDYDVIYVAEATEVLENEWEMLTTRLRNNRLPYQQIIGDCNPSAPTHWLRQRCDSGKTVMLESRHEDNPALYDHQQQRLTGDGATYLARLDALTGVRKQRLRYGRWVGAEGVVYDEWDPQIHMIDRAAIPDGWRRIRVIDFGHENPFVCLWMAMDHDGDLYVYRYIYMSRRKVADHAKDILAYTGMRELIEATVVDWDVSGREILEAHGISTVSARKDILRGIEAVKTRLGQDERGLSRLYVMRDALVERDDELEERKLPWCIEQEFDSYIWQPGQEGKTAREIPKDLHNHAMDALRYGVMYFDDSVAFDPTIVVHQGSRLSRRQMSRRV